HDVVVQISPPAGHPRDRELLGEVRDGHGDVELPAELGGEGDVLAREGQAERRRVIAVAEDGPRQPFVEVVHPAKPAPPDALPGRIPSRMPPGPTPTASTSRGPGTEVTITSARPATSAGDLPTSAPRSVNGRTAASLRSWTTSGYPAFAMFPAIPAPMFPSPM